MITSSDVSGIRGDFSKWMRNRHSVHNASMGRLRFLSKLKAAQRCQLILACLRALRRHKKIRRRDYEALVLVALNDKKRRENRRLLPAC
jgi:hypothetical protein